MDVQSLRVWWFHSLVVLQQVQVEHSVHWILFFFLTTFSALLRLPLPHWGRTAAAGNRF